MRGLRPLRFKTRIRLALNNHLRRRRPSKNFHLALSFFYWTPSYVLAVACLSAYAKARIPDLRVSLLPIKAGTPREDFLRQVLEVDPDLLGVSSTSPAWPSLEPYLRELGQWIPRLPIVVGGYQAILSPSETLSHPAVRFVCAGEGEQPLVDLILRLQRGDGNRVPGLWEKTPEGDVRTSEPAFVSDLSSLPFPDYSIYGSRHHLVFWGPHAIESEKLLSVPVLSGRGCPHRCTYCNNTSLLDIFKRRGHYVRKYNAESVIAGLVKLKDEYSVDYFQFADEMFLSDMRHAHSFLRLYREKVGLPFSMFSHVSKMTFEFCRFAATAGCHSMWFGLESGSESYRRRFLNRGMTNEEILSAAADARRAGIKIMVFNMIGMPFETKADMLATIEFTKRIAPERAVFGQYVPLPRTPLYDLLREAGLLLPTEERGQMWELGRLNIKEHPNGATRGELAEIVEEIARYHAQYNRFDS